MVDGLLEAPKEPREPLRFWVMWTNPKEGWCVELYDADLELLDDEYEPKYFRTKKKALEEARAQAKDLECIAIWHDKAGHPQGHRDFRT